MNFMWKPYNSKTFNIRKVVKLIRKCGKFKVYLKPFECFLKFKKLCGIQLKTLNNDFATKFTSLKVSNFCNKMK